MDLKLERILRTFEYLTESLEIEKSAGAICEIQEVIFDRGYVEHDFHLYGDQDCQQEMFHGRKGIDDINVQGLVSGSFEVD